MLAAGADLLVTHHPLLLTPVHGVPADDPKGRLVHRLVRAGAGAVRRAHQRRPRRRPGVNDALAAVLGLRDAVPLEPADGDPRAGLGRVGDLERAMTLREFAGAGRRGPTGDGRRCARRRRSERVVRGSPSAGAAAGR